jgi:hypothetical protein
MRQLVAMSAPLSVARERAIADASNALAQRQPWPPRSVGSAWLAAGRRATIDTQDHHGQEARNRNYLATFPQLSRMPMELIPKSES